MRNLLIFLLILGGIWWVRRALNRSDSPSPPPGAPTRPASGGAPERMMACAHCGIHVPESEGVRGGGAFYCCEEHRRLGSGT